MLNGVHMGELMGIDMREVNVPGISRAQFGNLLGNAVHVSVMGMVMLGCLASLA